jgi:hypothetical protein
MTKRRKFLVSAVLLTLGFVVFNFLGNQQRLIGISILSILAVISSVWSLYEGLGLDMTLTTLILPAFFTFGVGIFWFLLPSNILVRMPIFIIYGIGIYVLSLTSNIYTVSAIRTIALLRAARGVGFVLTLLTYFLIYDAIYSLRAPIYVSVPAVLLTSFPLFFQGYWSASLDTILSKDVLRLSIIASVIMTETAVCLYFWPATVVVGSLFLTVSAYVLLGLGQAKIETRLFSQTVKEYLILGVLVFVGMFFATHWGGV